MTVLECREALNITEGLKWQRGALDCLKGLEWVETKEIGTGFGTKGISVHIPARIVAEEVEKTIARLEAKLVEMGVDVPQ
jgi:hypothetical protein